MTYAKTIGIIAVVIGHSGSPLTDFVYQWHIVLFFFISGYFYKETYSKTPVIHKGLCMYAVFCFALPCLHPTAFACNVSALHTNMLR